MRGRQSKVMPSVLVNIWLKLVLPVPLGSSLSLWLFFWVQRRLKAQFLQLPFTNKVVSQATSLFKGTK